MARRKVCFFSSLFSDLFVVVGGGFVFSNRITYFWSGWKGSVENKIPLKHVIAAPVVSITCLYFNSQLSLNKHAELLFFCRVKSDNCLHWCFRRAVGCLLGLQRWNCSGCLLLETLYRGSPRALPPSGCLQVFNERPCSHMWQLELSLNKLVYVESNSWALPARW